MKKSIFFKKRNMAALALLLTAIIISTFINYSKTGVFLKTDRKLPIYCVDTKEKKVSLTFDASWGDDKTDKILDILDKYQIKATFFLVGGWVDDYPEKVKELKKRGHEIGNHSTKHPDMTTISRDRMVQEIAITDAKIRELTGEGTILFRCPSGAYNNAVIETVESTNHYCIQWDVDSIDWKGNGADIEYNRVIKKVKPGSILLFHNDAKYTPETLPRIIEYLKAQGYSFVKTSDLIYKDNYYIDSEGKQCAKTTGKS